MPKIFTLSVEVPDEKVEEMLKHFQGLQTDVIGRFRYVHMGMAYVDLEDERVTGWNFEVPEGGYFRGESPGKIEIYDGVGTLIRTIDGQLDLKE